MRVKDSIAKFFERLMKAKAERRKLDVARPVAEKMRMLDRLHERNKQLKRAKPVRPEGQ